jgi:ketosteroid isomerase-like protein
VTVSEQNVELARRVYEALDRHDRDGYLALMHAEVEIESLLSAVEGGYRGLDGVRRWWDDFLSIFPDYRLEIEELRAHGEGTVGRFRGTAHGASGETPIVDPFWHAMKWRDGKCVWWRSCASEAEALEAIDERSTS